MRVECIRCHTLVLKDAALSVFIIVARSRRACLAAWPIQIANDPCLHDSATALPTLAPLSLAFAHQATLLLK